MAGANYGVDRGQGHPTEPPVVHGGVGAVAVLIAIEYAFEGERLADAHVEPSVFASAMRDGIVGGDADQNPNRSTPT